jgi:hypothetical protein
MVPGVVKQHEANKARREAHAVFKQLQQQAWVQGVWSKVIGRHHALLNLYDVCGDNAVQNRSHAGICTVPIDQIRGSEGRCRDFDVSFRPLQDHSIERWISVACARQADVPLPAVALVRINDTYFVRDGHHRISVARWLGQKDIEAEVTVWHRRETDMQQANQTAALPAINPVQRPTKQLVELVARVGERLLTMLQKVQPVANRTLIPEG